MLSLSWCLAPPVVVTSLALPICLLYQASSSNCSSSWITFAFWGHTRGSVPPPGLWFLLELWPSWEAFATCIPIFSWGLAAPSSLLLWRLLLRIFLRLHVCWQALWAPLSRLRCRCWPRLWFGCVVSWPLTLSAPSTPWIGGLSPWSRSG